jgi:hypothetical protein
MQDGMRAPASVDNQFTDLLYDLIVEPLGLGRLIRSRQQARLE